MSLFIYFINKQQILFAISKLLGVGWVQYLLFHVRIEVYCFRLLCVRDTRCVSSVILFMFFFPPPVVSWWHQIPSFNGEALGKEETSKSFGLQQSSNIRSVKKTNSCFLFFSVSFPIAIENVRGFSICCFFFYLFYKQYPHAQELTVLKRFLCC